MRGNQLAKKRISAGVSLAIGSMMGLPASTATAESGIIEEVVVKGIRSSLRAAMDTKRDSMGVVDAITSEDIGKFPDTNLAESLQRITGVSIDRERGEGSRVTVRGFGPDFNLVTLNGRQMPTHSGDGRSFDFADLAAESVSGVEIYKTGQADVPTGGIGSTINIKTTRPLQNPGLVANIGAKAVRDNSTVDGDNYTPEVSGIFSQTFFDNTVGVAVSASYQERHNGEASAFNTSWLERDGANVPDNGQQTNLPSAGDIVALPQQIVYQMDEWERERINGQATLQWRPVPTVEATLDYTMANLELDHRYNNMSIWFSPTGQSGDWSSGPIVSPNVYTESNNQPDMPMGAGVDASKNEIDSVGFNLQWDATDRLSLEFDYHESTAERSPNSPFGSSALITIASFARQAATVDYTDDIPVTTVTTNDPLSPDDMQITGSVFSNSWAKMDIEQARVKANWAFTELTSIDFGASLTEVDNFESGSDVQRNTWGQNQASAFGSIANLMVPASLAGVFDEISGGEGITNNFFLFDMEELAARGEFLQQLPVGDSFHLPTALTDGDCGTGFCADGDPGFGNQYKEESIAGYVQFNHGGNVFERPYNFRAGLRYEETDVTSSAESVDYVRIDWASTNEFTAIEADELIPSGLEASYKVWLPSTDFDLEIIDNLKLRASYSETISRAGYGDLRGNLSIGSILRVVEGEHIAEGTVGNPGLKPHESKNIDLSLEWYYGIASYVSVGYFDKSVKNFVTSAEQQNVLLFPNLAHPALGPLYDQAIGALGATASNADIRNYIFTNLPSEAGVDVATQTISGVPDRDGTAFFEVETRINSDDKANIDGWEITLQHEFGESGFGFIANATFASGSAKFDDFSDEPQFALPGLSDTRNLIAYFDKYGLQVRVAYNWRDSFFTGGVTQPSYTDEYEQWDINASYEVRENLVVFVEGINITNETFFEYARSELQSNRVGLNGERYQVGFRFSY